MPESNEDAFDSSINGSDFDRRKFFRRAGVGAAVVGGAWVAPSIVGSSVAFAAGSFGGGEFDPPDPVPSQDECGTITWPAPTDNNPTKPGAWITYPLQSSNPAVQLTSVVGTLVGPNPPSTVNPQVTAGQNVAYGYRNLMSNARPFQGQGTISGDPTAGLVIVQNNAAGGNTDTGSIDNYQQVTFTFNTVIQNLRFQINDLSATTIDRTNTVGDTVGPLVDLPVSGNDYPLYGGKYRDTVGFNRAISVTGGNTTHLAGTGTFSNPLRRTTNDDWFWGLSMPNHKVPMDVQITMPGPLSSFTMRYATVGGRGTQFIQLRNFTFGLC